MEALREVRFPEIRDQAPTFLPKGPIPGAPGAKAAPPVKLGSSAAFPPQVLFPVNPLEKKNSSFGMALLAVKVPGG